MFTLIMLDFILKINMETEVIDANNLTSSADSQCFGNEDSCQTVTLKGKQDLNCNSNSMPEVDEIVPVSTLLNPAEVVSVSSINELSALKKKNWHELYDDPVNIPSGLSKRQQKKYVRKVLWETKWKPLRRAKEKEKLKQKKLLARINNETLGPSRKKLKHSTMASSSCKLRIALDFSFDSLMSEKDLGKCLKQLNHCYCLNRRAASPLQLYITNFCGAARDQLSRGVAYKNWDLNFNEEHYLDIFPKEDLVYLTSDSNNILTHLDHSKVYIIGAFVDHNKYKGKTLTMAIDQGINHAQLPISDYLQMNSRKVLTIDHVFEILIHITEGISWKDSFLKVIPPRKKAVEKTSNDLLEEDSNTS